MRWPWVSRLAFDLLHDEVGHLRARNEELTGELLRIRRKESGMTEVAQPRTGGRDDMPPEVVEYIRAFESEAMQAAVQDDVRRARMQGTSWNEIIQILRVSLENTD